MDTAAMLAYVKPLAAGEARESTPREDVAETDVLHTLPFMLPIIRDMVILQRISGARPSEIFGMTLAQFVASSKTSGFTSPSTTKPKR